jgi:hypothetical protein
VGKSTQTVEGMAALCLVVHRVHGNHRPCNASPNRTLAPVFSTELP